MNNIDKFWETYDKCNIVDANLRKIINTIFELDSKWVIIGDLVRDMISGYFSYNYPLHIEFYYMSNVFFNDYTIMHKIKSNIKSTTKYTFRFFFKLVEPLYNENGLYLSIDKGLGKLQGVDISKFQILSNIKNKTFTSNILYYESDIFNRIRKVINKYNWEQKRYVWILYHKNTKYIINGKGNSYCYECNEKIKDIEIIKEIDKKFCDKCITEIFNNNKSLRYPENYDNILDNPTDNYHLIIDKVYNNIIYEEKKVWEKLCV
jgi:hypothetical protein